MSRISVKKPIEDIMNFVYDYDDDEESDLNELIDEDGIDLEIQGNSSGNFFFNIYFEIFDFWGN